MRSLDRLSSKDFFRSDPEAKAHLFRHLSISPSRAEPDHPTSSAPKNKATKIAVDWPLSSEDKSFLKPKEMSSLTPKQQIDKVKLRIHKKHLKEEYNREEKSRRLKQEQENKALVFKELPNREKSFFSKAKIPCYILNPFAPRNNNKALGFSIFGYDLVSKELHTMGNGVLINALRVDSEHLENAIRQGLKDAPTHAPSQNAQSKNAAKNHSVKILNVNVSIIGKNGVRGTLMTG